MKRFPILGAFGLFLAASSFISPGRAQNAAPPVETISNQPPAPEVVQMSQFDVSASGDRGYMTTNTVGATLLNTPIENTPMSIVALNSQFVLDVGAIDPVAAASYVSGVTQAGAPGSGQLTVRGQDLSPGANIRDGIVDAVAPSGDMFQDQALMERIEVIKGPEGTLYGTQSNQGGMVNLITKAPQPTPMTSYTAFVGADEFGGTIYRGVLDTTGAYAKDPNWEYRFILVGQKGKSLQDINDSTFVVSPALKYLLKGGGSVLLRYIYQNPDRPINNQQWMTDAAGTISKFISAKSDIGDSNTTRNLKAHTVDFDFTQPFATGPIQWQGRYYFRYNHEDDDARYYNGTATTVLFLNAAGQVIGNQNNTLFSNPNFATLEISPRSITQLSNYIENADNNLDFVGNFDAGPSKNQLLMYSQTNRESYDAYSWGGANYPPLIVWSAVPGVVPVHPLDPDQAQAQAGMTLSADTDTITTLYAVGAQENMSFWNDRLIFVAGIRDDRQAATTFNRYAHTEIPDDIRKGVTHKYGVVFRPIPEVGLFYNYAQTFAPNGYTNNILGQSVKLPNLNSTIEEEGAKIDLFHGSVVMTSSYFETKIADETVLVPEVNTLGQQVSISVPAGQAVIKGWEADGTIVVSRNLDIVAGAGNLSSETQTGLSARAVPYGTNYRIWAKYSFTETPIKGAFVGLGLQHNGPAAGDSTADFVLPPFTVYNGLIGYAWGRHWRAQVNVNNLTNANYATVSTNRDFIYASMPRDASLTLVYTF